MTDNYQKASKLSQFELGQKVIWKHYDEHKVFEDEGWVTRIYKDHIIVNIPRVSDHCYFSEDFNMHELYIPLLSTNEKLATNLWNKFCANIDDSDNKERFISEIADELDHCGEDVFLIRNFLCNILKYSTEFSLYKGDLTEPAWQEIADDFFVNSNELEDEIRICGMIVGGYKK